MNIAVFGSGYVGLVTGACFSDFGNHVTLVDVNSSKIDALNAGRIPIYEPGLEEMIVRNRRAERLSFTSEASLALEKSEIVFVAVGTPESMDGSADLSFVEAVAETVATHLSTFKKGPKLFVLKSTVPVGTADICRQLLPLSIEVASNPEFLKEGSAVSDFLRPDRIVIGTESATAREILSDLYVPFVKNGAPILLMSNCSAEISKYAANSFLAMKVSFINDLAIFAEKAKANISDIRAALVSDPRIGGKFLYPGAGYGGSCFPKDIPALAQTARSLGHPLRLVEATHEINVKQRKILPERILKFFREKNLSQGTVALWGISFKAETDDIRESAGLVMVDSLCSAGMKLRVYDPQSSEPLRVARKNLLSLGQLQISSSADEALNGADVLAVMTEWNEFRSPDYKKLAEKLKFKALFDGKNIYRENILNSYGLKHFGIGLKAQQ